MSHSDQTGQGDTSVQFPFETVSSDEMSKKRWMYHRIDKSVLTPFRIIWSDWRGKVGLFFVTLYVLMGTVGVHLIDRPTSDTSNILVGPFEMWEYPLGTDGSGAGMLAAVVHATPPMLKMILAGGMFATAVGAMVGMIAGYKGGTVDQLLMLITDTLMTIPGLPLIIVISFILQPRNPFLIGIILAIAAWTGLARSVRSQTLPLRHVEYVEANRLMGISTPLIILKDILPNLAPYILIAFVGASRGIIFDSVALYFLGVLPTSQPNWGIQINQAYSAGGALYSWDAAHWVLVPIIAVVMLSFGLIMLAQASDQLFNPRIRARHQKTTKDPDT